MQIPSAEKVREIRGIFCSALHKPISGIEKEYGNTERSYFPEDGKCAHNSKILGQMVIDDYKREESSQRKFIAFGKMSLLKFSRLTESCAEKKQEK